MSPDLVFNTIGVCGMLSILLAYYLLQKGTCNANSYPYLLINMTGGVLLLISLFWDWNLASVLLEIAWITITAYGLYKRYRKDSSSESVS